jgi:hypothetical protein
MREKLTLFVVDDIVHRTGGHIHVCTCMSMYVYVDVYTTHTVR